jgi:hypothetical protein
MAMHLVYAETLISPKWSENRKLLSYFATQFGKAESKLV